METSKGASLKMIFTRRFMSRIQQVHSLRPLRLKKELTAKETHSPQRTFVILQANVFF